MTWKPIKTAPRNGTAIFLMNENNNLYDVGWWSYSWNASNKEGEWSTMFGNGEMTHWTDDQTLVKIVPRHKTD